MKLFCLSEHRISFFHFVYALAFFPFCFFSQAQDVGIDTTSGEGSSQEIYEGSVTEVLSSGTFLFESQGKEFSFLLYGINFSKLNDSEYETVKEYVSETVLGKEVKVVVVRELASFKFVRLYSPEDVVAELIGKGLAPWDKSLARNESIYEALELSAKESAIGIWGVEPPKSDNPLNLTKDQRIEFRQQVKFLNFEAMLDRWSRLDAEGRTWYRENVHQQLVDGQAEKGAVLSQLRNYDDSLANQQSVNNRSVQQNINRVYDSKDSEEEQREEAYDDPTLNLNKELLEEAIDFYGEPSSSPYHPLTGISFKEREVLRHETKVKQDQKRVDAEAEQISREHEAERVEYYDDIRQKQQENARINQQRIRNDGLDEALSINLRMQNDRLTGYIDQINSLDKALDINYEYSSTFSDFHDYPHTDLGDEIYVGASLRFVVVTWDAPSTFSGIDLYRGPDVVLYTRLFHNKPAYKRFYILEPGYEYVLKPKIASNLSLRYMDFKPGVLKN